MQDNKLFERRVPCERDHIDIQRKEGYRVNIPHDYILLLHESFLRFWVVWADYKHMHTLPEIRWDLKRDGWKMVHFLLE